MGNDTRLTDARMPLAHTHTVDNISGLGTAATVDTTNSISQGGTGVPTAGAVWTAIDNLPEPMILKGTLGTGGTITSLPTAAADNEGFTYKVITAGTYAGQAAKVGDFFVSCKPVGASAYEWVWFPSGDESFTDTWRNIKVNGTEQLATGISSGAVDFVNGTNTTVAFDASGNKISVSVPAVSSTSAGVAPQGAAVSSQSQTTKFLREDGTWAAPSYTTNTDRYVNSAAFADDSTSSANSPIKMTLTRAGSDSTQVTGNIPKVSSSSAGVAPKGAAVSSQSQTTKFLREDGTWAAPSYTVDTNTTYTVATGDANGQIKVTPSSGSAYNVAVKGLGSSAYANLANTVFEVGKAASRSTATVGTWTAMCNTSSTGSPKLPSASKWWNVMSLNNWSDSATNWVSQLGVPTQDVNGTAQDTVWFKHNDAAGTNIDSSTWHSLVSGNIVGAARYGTTGSTTKIKININAETSWMMSFVVTVYQGYVGRKFLISGYNYGGNHWHSPQARLISSTDNTTANVYFGYDANYKLWVGFDGGSYTGVSVSDVCNGYTQVADYNNLFTITNVSSLATLQTTITAVKPDAATVNGLTLSLVT